MAVRVFGFMPDGTEIRCYTLKCKAVECEIITYGAALRSLRVPDKSGTTVDVLLGFDSIEDYLRQDKYIGAVIGRFANRIAKSSFELNGNSYQLSPNEGENSLHGGKIGFDKKVWSVVNESESSLTLEIISPDGQEGYPGEVRVSVTYALFANALSITYRAVSDKDTLCNLTSHGYFRLDESGTIENHYFRINSERFIVTDLHSIPTGEIRDVSGTAMDLTKSTKLSDKINQPYESLITAYGFDHCYLINEKTNILNQAASAYSEKSGILLSALTDQKGIQFYTGNFLAGCPQGKNGEVYTNRSAFCFETGGCPDSPHHPSFPQSILRANKEYLHQTVYTFSIM